MPQMNGAASREIASGPSVWGLRRGWPEPTTQIACLFISNFSNTGNNSNTSGN